MTISIPNHEEERLKALQRYQILDTLPEQAFDDLTHLAASICGTPIALVSLVDENRQWFKSKVGLAVAETPREVAFCAYAIANPNEVCFIPNTLQDSRFATNPLVTSEPKIRFYAGVPLVTSDGYPLGTLCVVDTVPRSLSSEQIASLEALARQVMSQLELRHRAAELEKEKQLSKLKTRFISMVSHEFRTPLAMILSSSELLENYSHKWSEEKKLKHFQRIQAAIRHMTNLLDDVLLIGKAEAGKLEFSPAPLDLKLFCKEVIEVFELTSSHQIVASFPDQCPTACLDEKLLWHILTNLLSNAIKYSPKSDRVEFDLTCEANFAIIRVQDFGIGIPPEDQSQLFESFHRGKNVGTISGTGLGLAILKRAVDYHGGEIAVESQVGIGTTFTVTLPYAVVQ